MTTTNPITGDPIKTKPASDNYRENFDRVFRKACPRCGKVNAADIHTCTPPGDGLCDKCDPDACCRL